MPEITFLPSNQVCKITEGTTVLQAANAVGVGLPSCCGGQAVCTTCRVVIKDGVDHLSDIATYEADMLELLHLGPSYRLGCQTRVFGDVIVHIPE